MMKELIYGQKSKVIYPTDTIYFCVNNAVLSATLYYNILRTE